MGNILERAKEATTQFTESAVERAEALRAAATDLDVAAFSAEKIQELLSALDAALPFVREAGYELEQTYVELGLPPRLVVKAHRVREISEAEAEELRERAGDAKMTSLVLRTFLRAAALQRTISLKALVASQIEFEISPVPRARLYFEHTS